jgi:hypothetical protein
MALTKAKVSFVEGVDGSALTGAMPAVDGASLTGISGMTKTTSDPLVTTNPATGVGTVWLNKSTSELFGCTDATTDENVWVNIGGGFGNYGKSFGGNGPGTIAGFTAGGSDAGSTWNVIDKFTFGSANNATDHGNLSVSRYQEAGHSSRTHGYSSSGHEALTSNVIDKFPFATNSGAVDHGDLLLGVRYGRAGGASSATDGYILGGQLSSNAAYTDAIQRFSFESNIISNTHGNLTVGRAAASGHSSDTHGYTSAGNSPTPLEVTIDKFAFVSEGNATDHGDLLVARYGGCGHSSTTDGYNTGGHIGARTDAMDKFAFSSNVTASDHGNLVAIAGGKTGQSSTTHGYASGGYQPPIMAGIDKFAFGSANNATDHGDLSVARSWGADSQY